MTVAFRNVDLVMIKSLFSNFNYKLIFPSFIIVLLMYIVHGLRWANITNDSNYKNFILITFLGFAINSVLPMRMGDVIKIVTSKKYLDKDYSTITSTVLFAQYLDFIFVSVTFSTVLILFPDLHVDKSIVNNNIYTIVLTTVLFSTLVIFTLPYIAKIILNFQRKITLNDQHIINKILNYFLNISYVLESLVRDYKMLYKSLILTFIYWILILLLFLIVAYGFEIQIPIEILIFSILLTNLAIILPLTPSSIGTFHVSMMFGLLFWSDDQNISFAYATTVHGIIFLSNITLGIISLLSLNLKNTYND